MTTELRGALLAGHARLVLALVRSREQAHASGTHHFRRSAGGAGSAGRSHIVLAELLFLLQKHGQQSQFGPIVAQLQASPCYRLEAITLADIQALEHLSAIPEMHDRLIAVQSNRLGATVVTKDPSLRSCSQVQSVW